MDRDELDARKVIMRRSFWPDIPNGAIGVALGPMGRRVTVAWETGHILKMFCAEIDWCRFQDGGMFPYGILEGYEK